jgi:hypothetical protein
MTSRAYTALGWLVWHVGRRVFKYQLKRDVRLKLGAGATVLGVLAVGVLAARAATSDDE